MIEKRRYARASIDLPVTFMAKGGDRWESGVGKDISLGGIFIEAATSIAFASEVTIRVRLPTPKGEQDFELPAVVRWVRADGMGVQFKLLGALETHAITEVGKASP